MKSFACAATESGSAADIVNMEHIVVAWPALGFAFLILSRWQ
jgi:hypothetical protein